MAGIEQRLAALEKELLADDQPEEIIMYWPGDEPPGWKPDVVLHWPELPNHERSEP